MGERNKGTRTATDNACYPSSKDHLRGDGRGNGTRRTNTTLTPVLGDAEHRYIPPIREIPVHALLAHYHAHWVRVAMVGGKRLHRRITDVSPSERPYGISWRISCSLETQDGAYVG